MCWKFYIQVIGELRFEEMTYDQVGGDSYAALDYRARLERAILEQIRSSNPHMLEVRVTGWRPGSVIVTIQMVFDADRTIATKDYLRNIFQRPATLFDEEFLASYGLVKTQLVDVLGSPKSSSKGLSMWMIMVIIVFAAFLVVLSVIVGVVGLLRRRRENYYTLPSSGPI